MLLDTNGEPVYRMLWSKAVKDFRLRKVYKPKTYVYKSQLLAAIIQHAGEHKLDTESRRVRWLMVVDTPGSQLYY